MKTSDPLSPQKLSLDVFGTILFRRVADSQRRFRTLEGIAGAQKGWSQRRLLAERNLAQTKGPDLYSLEEIYASIGTPFPGPEDEMAMERQLCFPVSRARRLLASARQAQRRILFVSDMYLPGAFIQQLLENHGLWREGDRIYVSHEQGAAKHGDLFAKICQELSLEPGQVEHIGDNLRSDVLAPRQLGIRTLHFRDAEPNRYEIAWAAKGGKAGEAVADAIRATRLQFPEELDEKGQAVWETACGVAGPLFISYVLWLEKQARELGLKRLSFISRDGLIFKKIYDRLFEGKPGSPQSHYLYGSRQAWSGVRAARLQEEDIVWLTKPGPGISLAQFARRCRLNIEEIPVLPWIRPPGRDEPMSPGQLAELGAFLRTGPLRERVQMAGREACLQASAFLRQEGLTQGPYGLVDLGWFGNLQEYVADLIPETPPTIGFYLDLRFHPKIQQTGKARAFLGRPLFHGIDRTTSVTLLEILAGSSEGSVEGYREKNGRWEAVQSPSSRDGGPEAWADLQHQAMLALLEEILLQPGGSENFEENTAIAWENFHRFLRRPSATEAEVYGDIRFVSNQEGGVGVTLAPRVSLAGAWAFFRNGFWKRQISWPQAMMATANRLPRLLLRIRYGVSQAVDWVRSGGVVLAERPAEKTGTQGQPP